MEGRHFAAGPWFTVLRPGIWKTLDTITISDGTKTSTGRVDVKVDWTGGKE